MKFLRYIVSCLNQYLNPNMTADQVRDLLTSAEGHLTSSEQNLADAGTAVHEAKVRVESAPPNTDIPQDIGDRIGAIDVRVQNIGASAQAITNEAGTIAP